MKLTQLSFAITSVTAQSSSFWPSLTCNSLAQSYWMRSIDLYFNKILLCWKDRIQHCSEVQVGNPRQSDWALGQSDKKTFPPSLPTHEQGKGCWNECGRCGTEPRKARGESKMHTQQGWILSLSPPILDFQWLGPAHKGELRAPLPSTHPNHVAHFLTLQSTAMTNINLKYCVNLRLNVYDYLHDWNWPQDRHALGSLYYWESPHDQIQQRSSPVQWDTAHSYFPVSLWANSALYKTPEEQDQYLPSSKHISNTCIPFQWHKNYCWPSSHGVHAHSTSSLYFYPEIHSHWPSWPQGKEVHHTKGCTASVCCVLWKKTQHPLNSRASQYPSGSTSHTTTSPLVLHFWLPRNGFSHYVDCEVNNLHPKKMRYTSVYCCRETVGGRGVDSN